MNIGCEQYLEDPEGQAGHLAECAKCRAVLAGLSAGIEHRPVRVEALPLAPWEAASHRSWPLVVGVALAVIAFATALFAAAGTSPFEAIVRTLRVDVPLMTLVRLAGGVVQAAPAATIILFVVVNAIFFALLRRAPKGIDV